MASRRNNKKFNPPVVVSEEFRIKTENELRNFVLNENMIAYEFPSTLTNAERAWIHNYAKNYSYTTKSYGKDPFRTLIVTKKKDTTNRGTATIELDKESQQTIQAFLCKYPYKNDKADKNYLQTRLQNNENLDNNMGQLTFGAPQVPTFGLNKDLFNFRTSLPIWSMRDEIMEKIISNQVLVVKGETGSGKTTQIPQFILDYSASMKEKCRIICTQPRRISAISVAERVAQERGERTGQTIGYHIRLESCVGPKTTLIYCTNGILLRTLMNGDSCLNSITHIIIDEIHERDRFSDFLLICLRECLVHYPNLRLILMSATIDVSTFGNYFNDAPIIQVSGRVHSVCKYYLDEILTMIGYESSAMKAIGITQPKEINTETITEQEIELSLQAEMDECIEDCFSNGTQDAFNLFLQYILNDHLSIDYQHSVSGYTGLMAAAVHGDYAICSQLLSFGANIRLRSFHENFTAKDWAFAKQHMLVHEVLENMEEYFMYNTPVKSLNNKDVAKMKLDLYQKTVSDQNIDYDLLLSLLYFIHSKNRGGSILVFLAGYEDIVTMRDKIYADSRFTVFPYEIFTLHGMMQIGDQNRVFNHLFGRTKIILSTNIAETSITIDDVLHVIDSGKVKEKTYDALTGICSLQCGWISQSAAKQRAGRAGRTQNGICYRLYSRNRYESMHEFATPEMLRMPLHELCLQTKLLAPKGTKIEDFLDRAIERPSSMAVKNAIKHLQEIGALQDDENLTTLGQHLVDLPLEPRLAKMLIYSVIFKTVDPVLTIVAFLSYRDPFILPNSPHLKNMGLALRKNFSLCTFSDHMILLKAFGAWQNARLSHAERSFCSKNNVSSAVMEMVVKIRSQLLAQLRAAGFVSNKPPGDIRDLNENSNNWAVIKAVLTAGLYPNIAYVDRASLKIRTRKEKKISVNISSCIRSNDRGINDATYLRTLPTNWLIFEELSRTNNHHNIRSVTCVTPLTVALFSNDVDISSDLDDTDCDIDISLLNKWVIFEGAPDTLEMVKELRIRMEKLISKKIASPYKQYSLYDSTLLSTIAAALQKEDITAGIVEPIGIGQRPKIMNCTNGSGQEEYKKRLLSQKFDNFDEASSAQFLTFKQVPPQNYKKFTPHVYQVTSVEEITTQTEESSEESNSEEDMDTFRKQFEDLAMQSNSYISDTNNIVPYLDEARAPDPIYGSDNTDNSLGSVPFFNFGKKINVPYLDEARSPDPIYAPVWMDHITDPNWTIFCIIKTGTTRSIDVSIAKKVWIFAPYIEKKLKVLFETGRNVILFFSVQNSGEFQAVARLVKMPAFDDPKFTIQSSLEWISRTDIPFVAVQEFLPEQYEDGQQLNPEFGARLWKLFTNVAPTNVQPMEPCVVGSGRPITKKN